MAKHRISVTVNGTAREAEVESRCSWFTSFVRFFA
jgi:hypothetical protein